MRTQRSTLIADLRREAAHLVLAVTVEAVFTLRVHFFAYPTLSKGFAHGQTTSTLSTEACLFHYFEAEKTPGLISLVVYEAETMERLRGRPNNKSYSFYDTHNILRHS